VDPLPSIRAIGFDYTGVTANLPAGNIFEQIADFTGVEPVTVQDVYHRYNHDFQIGRLDEAALWRHVATDLGAADHFDEIWRTAVARLPTPNEPTLELVDAVRAAGYRVGLLSNLAAPSPWSEDFYRRGLDRHFDAVALSGETGFAKPNPEAFQLLANKLGVTTDELVFIDDRPGALAGVESIGVHPVLFTDLAKLKSDLRTLGLIW
jgi:putative hydrolase of the HAD superfamily